MAAPSHQVRAKVFINYREYYITGPDIGGDAIPAPGPDDHGLLTVAPDGACLQTGLHTGDIWLQVEFWDEPPPLDVDAWEELQEASLTATTEEMLITEWGDSVREDLPNLAFHGASTYRLRVSARGRRKGLDISNLDEDEEPVEEHLIQIWPSPPAPHRSLKASEFVAEWWREST